ncbi:MAG: response regulator transcription factor [Luteibacter sp.]|jgi:two-component system response regulator RegA|uniref:response regulator transcription factor n=1 Tax=Luteibacter TaxID=242605 RepID=UPI000564D2E6|nr:MULTISPECIES: response regulator transcription factor [unclassified Luteibacter]MDQ7996198.1 response regulator transcription factor [Luteibacter sp.]MDQ8051117.1 response regulator transcription factor [Luteibacter sp.]MDR6643869.1 two-component system response regulator RegA [Luteibacter sp. 1214]
MNDIAPPGGRPLLIVDDDATFARVLGRALTSRGFEVIATDNVDDARALTRRHQPRYCVLDLKLGDENGLRLIPELQSLVPDIRVLLLTGYASIATAVEAIKRGAHDYLAKPVDADAVVRALLDGDSGPMDADDLVDAPDAPLPLRRLEWEHIQRVLTECEGNISETARRLGMHRRTLQRKLSKHPVRERPDET